MQNFSLADVGFVTRFHWRTAFCCSLFRFLVTWTRVPTATQTRCTARTFHLFVSPRCTLHSFLPAAFNSHREHPQYGSCIHRFSCRACTGTHLPLVVGIVPRGLTLPGLPSPARRNSRFVYTFAVDACTACTDTHAALPYLGSGLIFLPSFILRALRNRSARCVYT